MLTELQYIFVPFLIAFLQVATATVAIGTLPALWILAKERRFGLLLKWLIIAALFTTAAVYGLPLAHAAWKAYTQKAFKLVAMGMGYFVSALFVPYLLPEPLRLARNSLRHDRPAREQKRRVRRKRRKEGMPRDFN